MANSKFYVNAYSSRYAGFHEEAGYEKWGPSDKTTYGPFSSEQEAEQWIAKNIFQMMSSIRANHDGFELVNSHCYIHRYDCTAYMHEYCVSTEK